MTIGVYQILNIIDGKRYIGSSKDVEKRLDQHRRMLSKQKHHNLHLQRAVQLYGFDKFQLNLITVCSETDLEFFEDLIIQGYKANQKEFGYNIREVSKSNRGSRTVKNTHKSGDKYNRITLLQPLHLTPRSSRYWLCLCDCGTEFKTLPQDVRKGHTKSCGCLNKERLVERITKWNLQHEPWNKKHKTLGTGNQQ